MKIGDRVKINPYKILKARSSISVHKELMRLQKIGAIGIIKDSAFFYDYLVTFPWDSEWMYALNASELITINPQGTE